MLAWRWREPCEKDVGSLQKLKMAPSWQSARKWGPQTYSFKELNSAKNLDELRPRFILVRAESLQSCPTLCDSMDCSPPGSSVRGLLQARIVEWVEQSQTRLKQFSMHACILKHFPLASVFFPYFSQQSFSISLRVFSFLFWFLNGVPFSVLSWALFSYFLHSSMLMD